MAAAGSLMNLQDVLQAEAMACIESLKLAICLGMYQVIVETDSNQLFYALKDDELDNGINAAVIREGRDLLSLQFSVTQVVYCPRACNNVAHELARFGATLASSTPVVWAEDFPEFICNLVNSDLAVSLE